MSYPLLLIVFLVGTTLSQEQASKRLSCQLVGEQNKTPTKIDNDILEFHQEDDNDVKAFPFSFSSAPGFIRSAFSFMKNIPEIKSPGELPTGTTIPVTCDGVIEVDESEMKDLKDRVTKLTKTVEKVEEKSTCSEGMTYLDRCFRLMEIFGKTFTHQKAENLCNVNGGKLAILDSPLLFAMVTKFVLEKFNEPRYGNEKVLGAWTGMTYHMETINVTQGTFSALVTDEEAVKKNNKIHKNLVWMKGYPQQVPGREQVALKFRFAGSGRERLLNVGAMNAQKKRGNIPLCQFQLSDWQEKRSVSERLSGFKF